MDKQFSLYLDVVRFTASLLVVFAHFVQHHLMGKGHLPEFGREAVILFFVLSGFVITYATSRSEFDLRNYVVARCARIFSVVIPVLFATFSLVAAIVNLTPSSVGGDYQLNKLYIYIPMHLLFTGEMWNLSQTPPWIPPYWSLGYEVWYYIVFGAALFSRGVFRIALISLLFLIMGHKLLLLLPVWMSGVYLFKYQRNLSVSQGFARLGCIVTILGLVFMNLNGANEYLRALGNAIWPFPSLRLGSADRYLADYAVCMLVYLHFAFARQSNFSVLTKMTLQIRSVAAYTFTLYLIHMPVIFLWRLFYPHDSSSWVDVGSLSISIGVICYLFGFVTERRRDWFYDKFDYLYGQLSSAMTRLKSMVFLS